MKEKIQTVKGTKDLLFTDFNLHQHIIEIARKVVGSYGYQEMITPVFEHSELFKRTLGDSSDIVNKEMYSFIDKGGRSLTLRPEFTASVCRAFVSNGLHHQLPLKFFSHGPVFRNENPQKGRQRQFHQLNCEFLGAKSPLEDSEIIALGAHILEELGLLTKTKLEINSLGCQTSRHNYRLALVEYLQAFKEELSEDSKVRLVQNPLRILDSKDETDRKIIIGAPLIADYYTNESKEYFEQVLKGLEAAGVNFVVNTKLVRGLDYYCHTAFEFTTEHLGAQGTVLGGGRYDGLIASLGGPEVGGIGFAAGIERLALLLETSFSPKIARPIYLLAIGQEYQINGLELAQNLRHNNFKVIYEYNNSSIGRKLKSANEHQAIIAIFLGENEIKQNKVKIKNLDSGEETELTNSELIKYLERYNNV